MRFIGDVMFPGRMWMIALLLICLLVYGVLGVVAFLYARHRNVLYWSDMSTPVLVIILWVAVTATGYGHQSLSHVVEVPIALMISLILLNLRVFVFDRFSQNCRVNSYVVLGVSLLTVILLRAFMPYLPE